MMRPPPSLAALARKGLVWTGAEHSAMARPLSDRVAAIVRPHSGPVQWRSILRWNGQYVWTPVNAPGRGTL